MQCQKRQGCKTYSQEFHSLGKNGVILKARVGLYSRMFARGRTLRTTRLKRSQRWMQNPVQELKATDILQTPTTTLRSTPATQGSRACTKLSDTTYITQLGAYPVRKAKFLHTNGSFFRRELPSSLISFDSDLGKALFSQALADGFMESYFGLAAHFKAQSDPSYCGLTTLCVVLNSLNIEPTQIWKAPWRWFDERVLSCSHIPKTGVCFFILLILA